MNVRRWTWIVAALAAVSGGIAALTVPPIPSNDTLVYLDLTHSFSRDPTHTKTVQDLIYPPGYPLFLDVCAAAAGKKQLPLTVVVVQQALSVAACVLLFRLGVRLGRPRAALAAAAVYAFYLPRTVYAQEIVSETPFIFLILAFAHAFLSVLERPNAVRAARAGFLLAAMAAVRPAGTLLAPVLALSLIRRPRLAAAALAPLAGTFLLIILYNGVVFGEFALGQCPGRHLANQVYSDSVPRPDDPGAHRIQEKLSAGGLRADFPSSWWNYWGVLKSSGSAEQADRFLLDAAVSSILHDPLGHARRTALNAWHNAAGKRNLSLRQREILEWPAKYYVDQEKDPLRRRTLSEGYARLAAEMNFYPRPQILGAFGDRWLMFWDRIPLRGRGPLPAAFFLFGLIWAFAAGKQWRAAAILAATLHFLTAATESWAVRYFEPLMPLAMLFLAGLLNDAVGRLRAAAASKTS